MQKNSEIILIMTGTNGAKTYGFEMRSTNYTEEECRKNGYCYKFKTNTLSLNRYNDDDLLLMGFGGDEIKKIREIEKKRTEWKNTQMN